MLHAGLYKLMEGQTNDVEKSNEMVCIFHFDIQLLKLSYNRNSKMTENEIFGTTYVQVVLHFSNSYMALFAGAHLAR